MLLWVGQEMSLNLQASLRRATSLAFDWLSILGVLLFDGCAASCGGLERGLRFQPNTDYPYFGDYLQAYGTVSQCAATCRASNVCVGFGYLRYASKCYFKNGLAPGVNNGALDSYLIC